MPEFAYQELLPIDHHDSTPYRLLTTEGISSFQGGGHQFVQSDPGAHSRPEVATWSALSPLGRLGEPSDVARAAMFLASSDADYLTGDALNIAGGMVLH